MTALLDYDALDDAALARAAARRDSKAVRLMTQRYNQRLFRTAWSILKNRHEAEDAVQSAYLNAFAAIGEFAGRSSLSTWLTRIVINEALGRARALKRRKAQLENESVPILEDYRDKLMRGSMPASPEGSVARGEIRRLLEQAIARLPASFRTVFVLREIEQLDVAEVAETLGIPAATVKTRHLRARRRLQRDLAPEIRGALTGTFPFAGVDCERLTRRVVDAFCGAATGQAADAARE